MSREPRIVQAYEREPDRPDPGHNEPRRDHRGCRWMTCVVCRRERIWSTCAGHQTCDPCRGLQKHGSPRLQHVADATVDDLQETKL